MSESERTEPDVFFSYRSEDRDEARPLWEALKRQGLAVFVDDRSIEVHDGLTGAIDDALRAATVFVAYYSHAFLRSPYCVRELIETVVRALAADQLRQRILVVNPEPRSDHIEPIELRDARSAGVPQSRRELTEFAEDVVSAVHHLDGTLGDLGRSTTNVRWWPHPPVARAPFVGQHAPLLQLHSALNAGRYRFAEHKPRSGPAIVHGFGGIGKTSLVEQYAIDFAPAYPGGIVRLSARGSEPDDRGDDSRPWPSVLADYRTQVRRFAADTSIPVHDAPADDLLAALGHHLAKLGERCLWVVDDVPAGIAANEARELLVPAELVHTVLTTRDARHADLGESLHLYGLSVDDALVLLADTYPPDDEDEIRGLIQDVGGHPLALVLAGAELRHGHGAVTVAQQRERTSAGAAGYIGDAVHRLDEVSMAMLGVADALAAAPIPLDLLLRTLAVAHAAWAEEGETLWDRVVEALRTLGERGVVRQSEASVVVHRLVAHAHPRSDRAERRLAAATALVEVVGQAMTHARLAPFLVHARHLTAGDEEVPDSLATTLLQWLAGADRREGEHRSAGELGEAVIQRLTRQGDALDEHGIRAATTAAEEYLAVGVDDRAERLARRAVEAPALRGHADVACAHRALAGALDGQARFDQAEHHWAAAIAEQGKLDGPRSGQLTVDRIRALRLRGRLDEAESLLTELDAVGLPGPPSLAPAARHIEEANLHLLRGRPLRARRAAERALAIYHDAGLERDPACQEALSALIDAGLAAYARTPYVPMRKGERRFLRQARALCNDLADKYGPKGPLTLIARIRCGLHLVGWGPPAEGYEMLREAEVDARNEWGRQHPHRLLALYGLSVGALRLARCTDALDYAERAYEGQRETLGSDHPDTLFTQLQLGVARKLVYSDATAQRLVHDARTKLTKTLGPGHDEVWRAWVSSAMVSIPAPLLRRFVTLVAKRS